MDKNENGYSEYMARNLSSSCRRDGQCENRNMTPSENPSGGCGCANMPALAMVYSPAQPWRMIYTPEDALSHGTLFEELYKPLEDCYGK